MTITAHTTDDELLAGVRHRKAHLQNVLASDPDTYDSERLAGLVNDIAEEEGRLRARGIYRNALAHGADNDRIARALTRLLLTPVGDTWSGRKNDSRRAFHDGLMAEVGDLLREVES